MTAQDLLCTLRARGVELVAAGDRIRYRPAEAVTPDLRAAIVAHKPDLLALLSEHGDHAFVVDALDTFPGSRLVDDERWQAFLALAVRTWPRAPLASIVYQTALALAEIGERFTATGDSIGLARVRHALACLDELEERLRQGATS